MIDYIIIYNKLLAKYNQQLNWILRNKEKLEDKHYESIHKTIQELSEMVNEYNISDQEAMEGFI